ncbi:MAG TPA: PHB depolymerase family esterase [Candidatus Binatia bacterium]|nr:PHB depolymerase family esterase [Candidatus Binatia bacterium]
MKRFAAALIVLVVAGVMWRRALAAGGDQAGTIHVGGRTRSYIIHLPANHGSSPMPLIIVLHGATQGAANVERMSGMSGLADRNGFIALYPEGNGRLPTWNAGNCCGYAQNNHVDDVQFLRVLVSKLEKEYRIDTQRIYVTGISNGAMMSYRVACEMADVVAAVAPVEGAQNLPCKPSAPVSVIVFHGTADRLVPINGGSTPYQIGPRRTDSAVADTVAFWVKQDGCTPTPHHKESNEVRIDTYSGCKDGSAVAVYVIPGGHHLWPGTAISGVKLSATEVMWKFFAAHPKA